MAGKKTGVKRKKRVLTEQQAMAMSVANELSSVLQQAYEQGAADALSQILSATGRWKPATGTAKRLAKGAARQAKASTKSIEVSMPGNRKRAPRGLVQNYVLGKLQGNKEGISAVDLKDQATGEFEQMISLSSIRAELRKGQDNGTMTSSKGKWKMVAGKQSKAS
jgi:hypothetical protein